LLQKIVALPYNASRFVTRRTPHVQEPGEFRVDVGAVELAALAWAGSGDPVLLLHATGFHSHCWREVVRGLPGRRVIAVDLRAHGRSTGSGRVHWGEMAGDIEALLQRLDLHGVVGAGHSLGGHLLARAAAALPERFRHLVLIDPVIMPRERYATFRELPAALDPTTHPVTRRKNAWRDADEMFERFRDRSPFDTWQPQVLRDYCNHALRPGRPDEPLRLACDPLDEAAVYLGQVGNEMIYDLLPRLTLPVTLLRAPTRDGAEPGGLWSPTWPGLAGELPDCREFYLPDHNHFIPMQDPDLVAKTILAAR
jgi:pimeloyl-ACP methyl ester carboxylesterase